MHSPSAEHGAYQGPLGCPFGTAASSLLVRRPSRRPLMKLARISIAFFLLSLGCKKIPEGRSAVNEVQIRGADKVDDSDVEEKVATTESKKFLGLFRGVIYEYSVFDRFVLQRDLARVEAFYRSKGYFDAHARAGRIHQIDKQHVRVEIVVEEGEPVLVRGVKVEGTEGLPPEIREEIDKAAKGLSDGKPFEEEL